MNIHDLSPVAGSTHVDKRKGRGHATGNGKTAGRGHKGQKARSGGGTRIGFEGVQMCRFFSPRSLLRLLFSTRPLHLHCACGQVPLTRAVWAAWAGAVCVVLAASVNP